MSTRKKLAVSLSILGLTIIMAVVSVVGVIALMDTSFNFGGNISFTAGADINATISKATVEGGSLTDSTKMPQININATNDGSEAMADWQGVNLSFSQSGADVLVKFTITNHNPSKSLQVDIGTLTGTCTNAEMSAQITGAIAGSTKTFIPNAIPADAAAGTPEVKYSREIVITFHILDTNKDASITNFDIPISLQNVANTNSIPVNVNTSYWVDGAEGDEGDIDTLLVEVITDVGDSAVLGQGDIVTLVGSVLKVKNVEGRMYAYSTNVDDYTISYDASAGEWLELENCEGGVSIYQVADTTI